MVNCINSGEFPCTFVFFCLLNVCKSLIFLHYKSEVIIQSDRLRMTNSDTATLEPNSRLMTSLGIVVNLLVLIGLIVVSAYVTIRTFATIGVVLFSWHPSLMTIGVRTSSI